MRGFSLAGALLIAIGCAQQSEYTFDGDPSDGDGSGAKSGASSGKGGSSSTGGKTSTTGGKTSTGGTPSTTGGKTTAGSSTDDGGESDGGESGSSGGSAGSSTAGSAGKAGSGGTGGSSSGCTPTTSGPVQGLSARYESEMDGNGSGIGAQLVIFNEGPSTLNLADLKLRYYLTIENEVPADAINENVNWAFIRPNPGGGETPIKDKVSYAVVPLECTGNGADAYLEFTFAADAGNVGPGYHMRLSFTANNGQNQSFDQSNDYSFNKDQPSNTDYEKVVVIQNGGNRAWGTEP